MKKLVSLILLLQILLLFSSCECDHNLEPTPPFKIGWVVCTDGEIVPYCTYTENRDDYKVPIALVYWVNPDYTADVAGYAVYLNDLDPAAFSETEMEAQGTSADIRAYDGNENTWVLHSNQNVNSPLAKQVFDIWQYGQSAYIPSVGQLALLFQAKNNTERRLNERLAGIGGDPLADEADHCWYWSSTEVAGQEPGKAWLYSMHSGAIQETPKLQKHKARPIITIYR